VTRRVFRSQNGKKNALAAGALPRIPPGSLQRFPDPLAGVRGGKKRKGKADVTRERGQGKERRSGKEI